MQSRNQRKSLTDMPLEVMEKIIVDFGKISAVKAFRMKSVCRFFNEVGKTDEVYKHMELDRLRFRGWSDQKHAVVNKCIEMRNPNILFRNGLMKLFFLESEHERKTMLEETSALGHLDSTFVLGTMLMAEGRHRKQEALDMLNNAYCRAKGLCGSGYEVESLWKWFGVVSPSRGLGIDQGFRFQASRLDTWGLRAKLGFILR
ncbi:unnamed protein product [Lactuca saligna]|uniref:F-box domain-containing protein n=1 Tax=Lactuca saligna TaxID=75948 RepID=A0AA36E8D0_LACSI|nr:unnamed protein product [Lactuca saligna]